MPLSVDPRIDPPEGLTLHCGHRAGQVSTATVRHTSYVEHSHCIDYDPSLTYYWSYHWFRYIVMGFNCHLVTIALEKWAHTYLPHNKHFGDCMSTHCLISRWGMYLFK